MSDENKVSRRDFIREAAVGAAAMAGAGALAHLGSNPAWAQSQCPTGIPAKWDLEADVVVVGYGGSGACAAIAAKDAGASVIVLEKAPAPEGGNTGCATGSIHTQIRADDVDDFAKKIKFGSFGTVTDDELIRATAMDMQETGPWLEKLGAKLNWSDKSAATNQRPAGYTATIRLPDGSSGAGKDIFAFLHGVVTAKGITVKLATPAKGLVQNPETKEILGVKADSGGKDLFVKANKGVILACGGYENNPQMQGWFNYPGLRLWPWGTPYNTGDGINMCTSVGAALWHLHGLEWAAVGFRKATELAGCSVGTNATTGIVPNNYIFVNKYGKRFMNEAKGMGHDIEHKPVTDFNSTKVEYPNLPFFMVFDDTQFKAGPLSPRQARTGVWTTYNSVFAKYVWSNDNSAELAKGWIVKADTIKELAALIKGTDPSGRTVGVDAAALAETVTKFNTYVESKKDPEFARPDVKMAAIKTPPFYAVEMSLTCINTQGGPARNKFAQTLGTDGKPIPRLYNVGEFGSVNGFVYVAGNIAEALTTGRVAGKHAALLKPWGAA